MHEPLQHMIDFYRSGTTARHVAEKFGVSVRARTVIRPAAEVLDGMVGPDAAPAWQARYDAGDLDRLNAVLRFLFAAVRIGESTAAPFRLDFDRVSIERNELHA